MDELPGIRGVRLKQHLQPIDFGGDVRHVAQLQGSGDVIAQEMDARADVFGGDRKGLEHFLERCLDLRAFGGKCLIRGNVSLRGGLSRLGRAFGFQNLFDLPDRCPNLVAQIIAGDVFLQAGTQVEDAPAECDRDVLVREYVGSSLQCRGADELLGNQQYKIGFGFFVLSMLNNISCNTKLYIFPKKSYSTN